MENDTAKLVYWTWALVNMCLAIGAAVTGVAAIRAKRVAVHKRRMLVAGGLVIFFVLSYVVKLATLGGEDLDAWTSAARVFLWIHETFILVMLVGGSLAGWMAWKMSRVDPGDLASVHARHRRAGWTAVIASALGAVTAAIVLGAMYERYFLGG